MDRHGSTLKRKSLWEYIKRNRGSWLFWLLPLFFLSFFYFQPLVATFKIAFQSLLEVDFTSLWQRISQPLGFTIWQAFLSTILTFLVGLPAAYTYARFKFHGKALLRILVTIPFIMPTIVVAAGFNALIGPKGWLNVLLMNLFALESPPIQILNTLGAILIAHVFYNTSIVIRVVGGAWSQLDPRLEYAARVLGAKPAQVFKEVILPLLKPSLYSAVLLVFLFDFTSFAVILLMGGPRFSTLEVEIYTQALHLLNLPLAGLLSAIQLFFTLAITVVYSQLNARRSISLTPRDPAEVERSPTTISSRFFVYGMVVLQFSLFVLPLLSLVVRSLLKLEPVRGQRGLVDTGFTLNFYQELFINRRQSLFYVPPIEALLNSLWFGIVTVIISVLLGVLATQALAKSSRLTQWLEPVIMLPLGTSAVTLGLGFILVFNGPPIDVRNFPILIPIAHSLVALPFVVRTLHPAFVSIPDVYRQSAAVLGASPWRVWWQIDFPILSRAFLAAGIFAFTISLGEFGATTFLSRPETPTIPIAIYRYISQPGALNYGQALAMSTILMIICGLSIFLVERLQLSQPREF